MKIVYISSSALPSRTANSIHVMKMCQAFASNGHEVVLLAPDRRELYEVGPISPFDFYGVSPLFEIRKLPWPRVKGRSHIYGFLAARLAGRLGADVIYCRHLAGAFFAPRAGPRIMFESHTPAADGGRANDWIFRRLLASGKLDRVVVITHALARYYRQAYPSDAEKFVVAPDGADPQPADIQPTDLGKRDGRLQVGYVGHLYRGKGMEVIAALAPRCPWADFHVVGGTEGDIAIWKQRCGEYENVRFHGHVPHERVTAYLAAFDVVLLPNQPAVSAFGGGGNDIGRWTSPLKAFEYMAAGKPIVASDLPVLREVLEPDRNALLCPSEDIDAWQAALDRLNRAPQLRARLGDAARNDLETKYSWQRRASLILDAKISERQDDD